MAAQLYQEPEKGAALEPISVVLTTVANIEAGERLVRQLVEERRIACGSLLPGLISLYRWNEAVQREHEVLILMKTRESATESLFARVCELHPYAVPELLALPVAAAGAAYSRWLATETAEGVG